MTSVEIVLLVILVMLAVWVAVLHAKLINFKEWVQGRFWKKVDESSFEIERSARRDLREDLHALMGHLGIEVQRAPSCIHVVKKPAVKS